MTYQTAESVLIQLSEENFLRSEIMGYLRTSLLLMIISAILVFLLSKALDIDTFTSFMAGWLLGSGSLCSFILAILMFKGMWSARAKLRKYLLSHPSPNTGSEPIRFSLMSLVTFSTIFLVALYYIMDLWAADEQLPLNLVLIVCLAIIAIAVMLPITNSLTALRDKIILLR